MDKMVFKHGVTARKNQIKAGGRDHSKFDGQHMVDNAVSGYAENIGEGIFLGESLAHVDPALLLELMEYLTKGEGE